MPYLPASTKCTRCIFTESRRNRSPRPSACFRYRTHAAGSSARQFFRSHGQGSALCRTADCFPPREHLWALISARCPQRALFLHIFLDPFTKELPVARRVGLSLTGLWRLAIWRVVLGLYLIEIEMWATSPIGFQSNVTRRMSHMRSRFPLRRRARTPLNPLMRVPAVTSASPHSQLWLTAITAIWG